ncbi:MAG: ROK family protein [Actinobacteria bacterium]|nr:ROK family protein [Actinomycetota bacterium]
MTHAWTDTMWPPEVLTLSIDIGGSGLKASIVNAQGIMTTERVRIDTPYPCPPDRLVETVVELVRPLLGVHRVSVGFPGLVRHGHVLDVPSLSRAEYGGERDRDLAEAWYGFDLAHALAQSFQLPTKVVNDADMQGCAVTSGNGLEFVMTLGTGVGTALFSNGTLLPHLELSHGPFKDEQTFDIALGNAQRKEIGNDRWSKRVRKAIAAFDDMLFFDRIYVGGGNAKHLSAADIGAKGEIVPNTSGILGGVRVWDLDA